MSISVNSYQLHQEQLGEECEKMKNNFNMSKKALKMVDWIVTGICWIIFTRFSEATVRDPKIRK